MKIVSFNINGLRARPHQLSEIIKTHQPDIIGLQETKVADDMFPKAEIESLGYNVFFYGQKSHYGVALLSKEIPQKVFYGFPNEETDAQRRFIGAEFIDDAGNPLYVFNGYFPQGENRDHPTKFPNKLKFYADLQLFLEQNFTPNQAIILMGDFNISPTDYDIGIGSDNAKRWLRTGKCSFLPEERVWMEKLKAWGMIDSFRMLNPEINNKFSWFDYRSRGFDDSPKRGLRIDLIMISEKILPKIKNVGIDYPIRAMEKPSDHAPIWLEIES